MDFLREEEHQWSKALVKDLSAGHVSRLKREPRLSAAFKLDRQSVQEYCFAQARELLWVAGRSLLAARSGVSAVTVTETEDVSTSVLLRSAVSSTRGRPRYQMRTGHMWDIGKYSG